MKKVLSIILCLILIVSMAIPAFAMTRDDLYFASSDVPVIQISGDGADIVDKDGNALSRFGSLIGNYGDDSDDEDSDDSGSKVTEAIVNIMKPFLLEGIATGNWDNYYEALQTELTEMMGDIMLDENGEASNGSHLNDNNQYENETYPYTDWKNDDGKYDYWSNYHFYYDWRLDPMEIADQFHDYIETVKKTTGAEEVGIMAKCIGTDVVMAYLQKYGSEGIRGIAFGGSTIFGCEPISEAVSGKFKIDSQAISRILSDCESFGLVDFDSFVQSSIDLAVASGALEGVSEAFKLTVYKQIVKGATSAIVLSAVSYPSFWATVKVEDFDTALEYVFGEEGSEKRTQYAGLIEKITNYNEKVKKHVTEILTETKESGTNIGVISKYGTQIIPVSESRDKIGDSVATVTSSSFGATTADTIYSTLSDEYIAEQEAKGLGKYISPDKQIDASTCMFPDSTWFVKGVRHSNWTDFENRVLFIVATSEEQTTIDDIGFTQFLVPAEDSAWWAVPMTEENCDVTSWDNEEQEEVHTSFFSRIAVFIKALKVWFEELRTLVSAKLGN